MKKVILTISVFVLGFFFSILTPNAKELDIDVPDLVDGRDKVTMYLFRGEGCSHCYDFLTYFNEHASQFKDYFDIKVYEVWKNSDNAKVKDAVDKALDNSETGVPFIVIGDQYKIGFSDSTGEELIKMALEAYENKKYEDLVANLIDEKDLDSKSETLSQACEKEGIKSTSSTTTEESKISDGVVVAIIIIVVAAGVAGLIYVSRK